MPYLNKSMTSDDHTIIFKGSRASGITVAEDNTRRNLYMDGRILQSSMLRDNPNGLHLDYSQAMMCSLLFQPAPEKVLLVGLGGGSLVKFLMEFYPDVQIDVAEINAEVIKVARQFFLLPDDDRLLVINAPGEVVATERFVAGESYDIIIVDAFDDNGPARALFEDDFIRTCRSLIAKGGIFAMNLWNRPIDNFPAVFADLKAQFDQQMYKLLLAGANRNGIVFGFNDPLPVDNLMELKPVSQKLSRRTGVNFIKWLREIHWQNI